MSVFQILLIVIAVLLFGLVLPLSHAKRMALFMLLIIVGVLGAIGGGMGYLVNWFH